MKRRTFMFSVLATLLTGPGWSQSSGHKALAGSILPGDDFFVYANGAWLRQTGIPADRSRIGVWTELADRTDERIRALIQGSARSADNLPDADARKIGDFYAAFLDTKTIEAKGLSPLRTDLDRIGAIADGKTLAAYLGSTLRADVDALNATDFYTDRIFGLWVNQSFSEPTRNVAYLLQGGLGMPDREFYLSPAPAMADIRAAYRKHIATILTLAGIPDGNDKAGRILAFETDIARTHAPRAESEDVGKADNPWKQAEIADRAPGMDWAAFFTAAGLAEQQDFDVWHPGAVQGVAALTQSTPLAVWKDYLSLRLIERYAAVLPKAFDDEHFAFYGIGLSGSAKQRERWRRAIDATNAALGPAVGRLYVARYFSPADKVKIDEMVDELIAAYRSRIAALGWMAPATKEKALAKLDTLKVGIGYPDQWTDYSALMLERSDALGNQRRAEDFRYAQALAKLKMPADRCAWAMDPQTVNAVNLPLANALNFPAAILQPPFFDARADNATNFGAIGSVIGHEISHSFDDQGSRFDAEGRLHDWWTPEDAAHFAQAAERLVDQYAGYRPFADIAVNGKQTLSENIADVAGLTAAYDAYKRSLRGKADVVRNGLTGDQRFFLAFARNWRLKIRKPALRQQLLTDGHAPAMYRADAVRNLDAWYTAFSIRPGDKLYLAPAARIRVW